MVSPAAESMKHFIHIISLKLPDLPIVKAKAINTSNVTRLGGGQFWGPNPDVSGMESDPWKGLPRGT